VNTAFSLPSRPRTTPLTAVQRPPVPLTDAQQLREAVLLSFRDPLPPQTQMLQGLSRSQWKNLLHWLDVSGLALYFLDRMAARHRLHWLPVWVEDRLNENLADNTQRTHAMQDECIAIQHEFQSKQLSYLLLKGFSLAPSSVPRSELRSQLDLDFLIAPEDAESARAILEKRGYLPHAVSGRNWEFKTPGMPSGSLRDLYKEQPSRCVELHLEAPAGEPGPRIANAERRIIHGFEMPVLASVDLFLGQAVHLYKHISTGSFRCSHLLEFYRHVRARHDDTLFWKEISQATANNSLARLSLGVVTLLAERVLGRFAPGALIAFTRSLSVPVQLWVAQYASRCTYAGFPGNKLHLLLQRELAQGNTVAQSSIRRSLLPRRLPPPISHAAPNEPASMRLRRSLQQWRFIFLRLRFHAIEGLRYAWELRRWQQYLRQVSAQDREPRVTHAPALGTQNKGMTIL
jgi:hypothetical protein